MSSGQLVVGIDGSAASRAALRWAAGEAHRRCAGLTVVYVSLCVDAECVSPQTAAALSTDRERYAAELLDAARDDLIRAGVTVPLRTEARSGCAAAELLHASDSAGLLVVGRRRHDSAESLLGSVSHRVASFARCPVAVVPFGGDRGSGRTVPVVAVGASRSSGGGRALDAAFGHAQRVGGSVLAVRAWGVLDWAGQVSLYTPDTAERWRLASQHLLDEAVTRCRRDYPAVPVQTRLVRGPVLAALLSAATEADLLVLEGRLRDNPRSSQLGWTTTSLLAEAPCPVQVVGLPVPIPRTRPVRIIPAQQEKVLVGAR